MSLWTPSRKFSGRPVRIALWRVWQVAGLPFLLPLVAWSLVNDLIEEAR